MISSLVCALLTWHQNGRTWLVQPVVGSYRLEVENLGRVLPIMARLWLDNADRDRHVLAWNFDERDRVCCLYLR